MSGPTILPVLHRGYVPCANCAMLAVVPFRAPDTYEPPPPPNATHVLFFPEGVHAEAFCEPCARMLAECFS